MYDIRERVLPEWVDATPVAPGEARRFCQEEAAKALGAFEPRHLTLCACMRAAPARSIVRALTEENVLVGIQGESTNGVRTWMVHLHALYLEPGIEPEDELVAAVAAAMRSFLAWHGAKGLALEKSDPSAFGDKLMGAL